MILLVTNESERHGDQLVYELHRQGFHDYARLDLGTLCERNRIDLNFDRGIWDWSIEFPGFPERRIDSKNLRTVWCHRGLHPSKLLNVLRPGREDTDLSQAWHALSWLLNRLPPEMFPFGSLQAQGAAENKFRQLEVAASVGFEVLPSLYSSDPQALRNFATQHASVVIKTIGRQSYHSIDDQGQPGDAIFGARVFAAEDLVLPLQSVDSAQIFMQKAVDKVAEHRITVLPDRIIDCRIGTSSLPAGEVDYRMHLREMDYQIVEPRAGIESCIREYLASFGLGSGCFDFAETADGRLVFFECNPVGEWWWIQKLSGFAISECVAASLIGHHGSGSP